MKIISKIVLYLQKRIRRKRLKLFYEAVNPKVEDLILDLGGGGGWYLAGEYPWKERVIILDLSFHMVPYARERGIRHFVVADAVALPFKTNSIDIVFSNSVIEHVGNQNKLAGEIRRVYKKAYFVQTPNKDFPIDPHYLIPFIQYFPSNIAKIIFNKQSIFRWYSLQEYEKVYYLSANQLKEMFPGSKLFYERFLGIIKSFIVIGSSKQTL